MEQTVTFNNNRQLDFLSGGGEMGELIRKFDWENTPLGSPDQWPHSLKTVVRIMLTSQQPIWIGWGKDLIKLYNDPYKAIVGGKHPWALGKPASVVWKEIWNDIHPMLEHVMENNEGTYVESHLLIMERYGYREETYYTFSYSPVPDDTGNIGGMFCANTDDTEKIIGERQLALLRDLASRTVRAKTLEEIYLETGNSLQTNPADLPFAMIYLRDDDQQWKLVVASGIPSGCEAAPLIWGQSEKLEWPFDEVLNNGNSVLVKALSSRFKDLPANFWNIVPEQAVLVPIALSGYAVKTGILLVALNPFRVYNENYKGFVGLIAGQIGANLSNVLAFQEARRRAEALAEIDKAKTIFFSNVSHEFRTPLTLMLGPIDDAIHDPQTIPANKERLQIAHSNSLRLLKLVNTLLDFSRIEAGRVQAIFRPTDIVRRTRELASAFRSAIEKAGLKFTIACDEVSEPVYIDWTMWERIVFNLLSNALKFTFEGEISIQVRRKDDYVELVVKDTGTGIPAEELPKLFTRFHRIESVKGRTHEGSGIGLAMVLELVKLHGGTIHAQSRVNEGSSFYVQIPFGSEHLPQQQVVTSTAEEKVTLNALPDMESEIYAFLHDEPVEIQTAEASDGISVREKILIADDNSDMREYISNLLKNQYDVVTAKDGLEALRAAEASRPSLILSDIMMPNLDGFGLLKKIRENESLSTIPIIFLSARAGEEARVEGVKAGADDYLVKPFSARELVAKVATQLKLYRSRYEAERQLYNLFRQAPALIIILQGPNHVVKLANPVTLQVWGRKSEEVINKPFFEALPEVKGQGLEDLLDQVYSSGQSYSGAERLVKIDRKGNGELQDVYFTFVYTPMRNVHGEIEGVMVFANEVTEQVRARQIVEDHNKVLEMVTGNASLPQALSVLLQSVEKMSFNKMFCSILLADEKGLHLNFCAAPSLPEQFNILFQKVAIQLQSPFGQSGDGGNETGILNIATDPLWKDYKNSALAVGLKFSCSMPLYSGRKFLGVFVVYFKMEQTLGDEEQKVILPAKRTASLVIERKRIEEALRASEAHLKALVNATSDAIYLMNHDWSEMRQLDGRELIAEKGASISNWVQKYIYPEDQQEILEVIQESVRNRSTFQLEHRIIRSDGNIGWVFTRAIPVFDQQGELKEWFGAASDITDRKKAEQSLTEKNKELLRINNDLDNFIYTASHDLKAPMSNIEGLLFSLKDTLHAERQKLGGETDILLQLMEQSVNRFKTTIFDLTEITKVQKTEQEDVVELSLAALVEDVKLSIYDKIVASNVAISTDFTEVPLLRFSRKNLKSIIYNLMSNAIKYSDPTRPPDVTLRTTREQEYSVLSVGDNGLGINEQNKSKMFTMFKRFHDHVEGTGIGLYIVKRIIDNAGGKIEVESEVGKGTTFKVYFRQ